MKWKRAVGYGLVLWALPFLLSLVLFPLREGNRALFESVITVVGVSLAAAAALYFFRDSVAPNLRQGLALGFAWMAISVIVDLPIFLGMFHMSLADYGADIALTYLAFPAIAGAIALARSRAVGV